MKITTTIIHGLSPYLGDIIRNIRSSSGGRAFEFALPIYNRWLPYLASNYPVSVVYNSAGDGSFIVTVDSETPEKWERDAGWEGVMLKALTPAYFYSGFLITKPQHNRFNVILSQLESKKLITLNPVTDGSKTLTRIKAVSPSDYFGIVSHYPPPQPQPAPVELPPARPVPAGRNDLITAVRAMHTKGGKIDQTALLAFLMDVMGNEAPERSPDPQPLIDALEAIESGYIGDLSVSNIAYNALYAYRNKQTLTIAKGE